jgi:membrane-associated phospholipid phosphatase
MTAMVTPAVAARTAGRLPVSCSFVLVLALSAEVSASPSQPPPTLSALEVGATLVATAGGIFLVTAGGGLLPSPTPGMGPPDPGSVDARLSRWLHQPGQGKFLAGFPDLFGAFVLPVLPVAAYAWPMLPLAGGDRAAGYPGHRLLAYGEAIGWTYLLTGVIKYAVGRPRPYTEQANNHPELRRHSSEDQLSFFSGHASSTFAVGSFVTGDLSRYLRQRWVSQSGPAARFLVGSLLPYTVGYGLPALVSLSRMIDQQHWPSDVLVGALVGSLVGHLAYAAHFEEDGQPRRRPAGLALRPLPLVTADPLGGRSLQLGIAGRL